MDKIASLRDQLELSIAEVTDSVDSYFEERKEKARVEFLTDWGIEECEVFEQNNVLRFYALIELASFGKKRWVPISIRLRASAMTAFCISLPNTRKPIRGTFMPSTCPRGRYRGLRPWTPAHGEAPLSLRTRHSTPQ